MPELPDPLDRLEANHRSTRQAWTLAVGLLGVATLSGLLITGLSHLVGGPLCTTPPRGWQPYTCSTTAEWLLALVPFGIMCLSLFAGAWGTYSTWKNYRRWRPWLAALWLTVMTTMMVATLSATILVRLIT